MWSLKPVNVFQTLQVNSKSKRIYEISEGVSSVTRGNHNKLSKHSLYNTMLEGISIT